MKIKSIKTVGFRKFEKEFESPFFDITEITGGNTKGKTNILYAIVWAFLGTNLTGDNRVWLGNKKAENCSVEIKFEDNLGINHTIYRLKNKYENSKKSLKLDGEEVDEKDLQKFYSDKNLFLSILNCNFFISKTPAEKKKMLDKYLPEIDKKSVYNKLEQKDMKLLETVPKDISKFIQDLNDSKLMYEKKIENVKGSIEYANTFLNVEIQPKKVFEKQEELDLAIQELSFLNMNYKINGKDKQQKIVNELENKILEAEQRIKDISTELYTNQNIISSIKTEEMVCCPLCEQKIQSASKIATLTNMKKENNQLVEEKNQILNNLFEYRRQLLIERCQLHALESDNAEDRNLKISQVSKQVYDLEQEKLEIENYNLSNDLKLKHMNEARENIENLNKEKAQYSDLIENIKNTKKVAQKLYINYIEEKMRYATQYLKNVSIKYYTVLKDSGEIKDDFIIQYNGNDLKNLSRSETIATALELSNMLNKISKVNSPLFIDDTESCADYDFIKDFSDNTQIFISRVEKGQELQIKEAYSNNNRYLQAA